MEKAIYGMAMPFDDYYLNPDPEKNVFGVETTNRASVRFEELVGITICHDYTQVFGTTRENLFIQVTDKGVYFKLIPNTPLGWSAYKKVKRNALRHCSISYNDIQKKRNLASEIRMSHLFRAAGFDDSIIIEEYRKVNVFEICLTNGPANKLTFCTTNANDPRLGGLTWEEVAPIPETLIVPSSEKGPRFEQKVRLTEETIALVRDVKAFKKQVQEVLGR